MNLENLRCLLHVAEAGSFSQAARDSYLSQQAISDQIRRLEQHYQTPLLERTRPVRLTQAGAVVCDTAREVLAAMDHLEQQVARLREPACRLVISTGLVWTPPFLPAVIARFQQVAPHVEVQLRHPSSIYDELTAPPPGADLIVGNMPFRPEVEGTVLFQDTLSLVASEELLRRVYGGRWREWDRRLSKRAVLEDCGQLPLSHRIWEGAAGYRHIPGGFPAETLDNQDIVAYRCVQGLEAAVFPDHYARQAFGADPKLRIYPLYPEQVAFQVGMGVRKGRALSSEAQLFLRVAKEFFQKNDSGAEAGMELQASAAADK